jgi:hypothetical protein
MRDFICQRYTYCVILVLAGITASGQVNVDSLKALVGTTTNDSLKGRLLLDISRFVHGYTEESESYARQALDIAQHIDDRLLESDARYRLAWHAYAQSELQEGSTLLDSA